MIDDLPRIAAELEPLGAGAVLKWAHDKFGADLIVTNSFEDAALAHLVGLYAPSAENVLLDTQYLFPESLEFARTVADRYDLRLTIVQPPADVVPDNLWQTNTDGCCHVRKVIPLENALKGRNGWVTGVRRVDAPTRATTPVIEWDARRNVVKVNPIVAWSDHELDSYIIDNNLPVNPLTERGFASIGCWPCTQPVQPGEDRRAGRWVGQNKTECGLHVTIGSPSAVGQRPKIGTGS